MDCPRCAGDIPPLLEDALEPAEASRLEVALSTCPRCRAEVEALRAARDLTARDARATASEAVPPVGLDERIIARLEASPRLVPETAASSTIRLAQVTASQRAAGSAPTRRWRAAAMVAALALFAGTIGWSIGKRRPVGRDVDPALTRELAGLAAEVETLRDSETSERARREALESDLRTAREEVETLSGELRASRESAGELRARLERESEEARTRLAAARRMAAEHEGEARRLVARLERSESALTLVRQELASAREHESALERRIESLAASVSTPKSPLAPTPPPRAPAPPTLADSARSSAPTRSSSRAPRVVFTRGADGYEVEFSGSREEVVEILFDTARDADDPARAELALACLENLLGPVRELEAPRPSDTSSSDTVPGAIADWGRRVFDGVGLGSVEPPPRDLGSALSASERLRALEESWRRESAPEAAF